MDLSDETLGGIVVFAWYVVVCIGTAVCLKKAGRSAWKGFVPVLNAVELCRVAGLSGWWVLTVFVPVVNLLVPFYVALKLAGRFGASDLLGIAIGVTGFGLLPVLALRRWQYQPPLDVAHEVRTFSENTQPADQSPYSQPQSLTASGPTNEQRASRIRMIVLSMFYGLALLCIPGAMIVGTMAFGGATQTQVDQAGIAVGLFCLTPISLLIALIGGWVLHNRREYGAATSLVALPVLNGIAAFASFIWVLA